MEHNLVLNVVYPPGHGAQSKEKTFVLSDTIASLKAKAVEVRGPRARGAAWLISDCRARRWTPAASWWWPRPTARPST